MLIQFDHTEIFTRNQNAKTKIVVNRGGTRSSKTFSILQLFLYKALFERGKKFLILRKYGPSLKITTMMDFRMIIMGMGLSKLVKEEKMERNFWLNGNLIHFDSLDDPSKKKGSSWNYILYEEFTEFTYEDFMTMNLYLTAPTKKEKNQIFGAFNPVDEYHWIKTDLIEAGSFDLTEIVSTYKDNYDFLHPDVIKAIQDLEQQNPNFHRIYGLGEWGRLEDLIYSNMWDIAPMPESYDEVIYGLDFGFVNPCALVRICLKDEQVYEQELIYKSGLTNSQLIEEMRYVIPEDERQKYIFCDSAEPDRIEEINMAEFNAVPMRKGKYSVYESIMHTIGMGIIHITNDSVNLKKEKQSYSWKKTKDGKKLEEPVKYRDHLMDAERGALYTYYKEYVGGIGFGGFA